QRGGSPRSSSHRPSSRSAVSASLAECLRRAGDIARRHHVQSTTENSQASPLGTLTTEDLEMTVEKPPAAFKLGDRVKIRLSGGMRGRIVELRGPLGPGGAQIYRVCVRRKPKPVYIEVREDQLILIPPEE